VAEGLEAKIMSGKIYHPEEKHPEPYQEELGPDASKGLNYGLEGADLPTRTAVDIKELHQYLSDFTNDELQQIEVLQEGARLETGATYINLARDRRQEIQALGNEDVDKYDLYVAKKDVPFELWNRLLGVDNPDRTKRVH
jgi:hypothetical protein